VQAAHALARQLKQENSTVQPGEKNHTRHHTWAIVAMLADKDITGVLSGVAEEIDFWCFSGLENQSRGASVQHMLKHIPTSILPRVDAIMDTELQDKLMANQCTILSETVLLAKTVTDACRLILSKADKNDRIIIFGSFYTVAESMHFFTRLNEDAVELIN
jgi:dihydrofolate synthase/folylpolyglutamate synthase